MKNHPKNKFAFVACAAFIPFIGCANPNATIFIRVVDDEGKPIEKVKSDVYNIFDMDSKPGFTDENGLFIVFLNNILHVSGTFQKVG